MKTQRIVRTAFFALATFFVVMSLAYASSGSQLVVVVEHFPPWTIVEEGLIGGINIDIIEALARRLDLQLVYKECPWKRCLLMMAQGEGDVMTSLLRRPEREAYMHYVEPAYKTRSTKAFYVRKGDRERIRAYADIYSLDIGVTLGAKYFEPFDNDPNVKKHGVLKDAQNLQKLIMGRLDAVIGTESNIDYLIAKNHLHNRIEKAVFRHDREVPVYLAISKKSPYAGQLDRFNRAMQEMVADGEVDRIIDDFYRRLKF